MNKPFELDELLSRVKNLLMLSQREQSQRPVRPIRTTVTEAMFGMCSVNFDTHEVLVCGEPVRMTPLELRLLRYFLENEGRVISRNELLAEVWEMSGNLQTRAVDQFIARLRKKIEPDNATPIHLLTIRDAGYRFVSNPTP